MSPNRRLCRMLQRGFPAAGSLRLIVLLLAAMFLAVGCAPSSRTDEEAVPPLPEGSLLSELNPVERSLLWRANEARRKAGVMPLTLRPDLCVAARKHTAEMVQLGLVTRFSNDGKDVGEQLTDQGVNWNLCAINLAQIAPGVDNVAQKVVDYWLSQPNARRDLLFHLYDETGLSAQCDPKGQWFITQIYARRTSYWTP
ncbi:MAG: CAP domain-containing protein [Phycisphaerae bacterium]|nr:CAP domain-containing protein [Phycisphaerae bacterium]